MNVIGYDSTWSLLNVCKAINRTIGKIDPFSDLIFHPADNHDDTWTETHETWINDPEGMDGTLRLTFYAIRSDFCGILPKDEMDDDRECKHWSDEMWIIHVHKATGHVLCMKVQGETEPSLVMQTLAIVVPSLAIADLRDI